MKKGLLRLAAFVLAYVVVCCNVAAAGVRPPPNEPAHVRVGSANGRLELSYNGVRILNGTVTVREGNRVRNVALLPDGGTGAKSTVVRYKVSEARGQRDSVEQTITFRVEPPRAGARILVSGTVTTSEEGFPAETRAAAQERFPLVRNSVGLSRSLRNNAVYDRKWDWVLVAPGDGATVIAPTEQSQTANEFSFKAARPEIVLTFRPRYYQKHKNLAYFKPWTYKVWPNSIAGWCSWFAYFDNVTEADVERVSDIFSRKLKDYGLEYIQIDDGYQSRTSGLPKDWLATDQKKFPHGLAYLANMIRSKGLKPALWVNVHFEDEPFVKEHPDYFVHNAADVPFKGPWVGYGIDGSNPAAIETITRPLYRGLHDMGWEYVKIDALRHLLYDSIYPGRSYYQNKEAVPEDAFRNVLKTAREELGRDTYVLACWGVFPEAVGIADACRLGTDGFGPTTLLQYNSWNNIVWRNDPDHVDIVKPGEEIIRPVLVSMAGAQMLLTDKAETYEDDRKLEGVRRSAPILFSLPGQLYDFDPTKTDNVIAGLRNQNGGAKPGPIDADQQGKESPWWLLEINRPFENWTVLARLSWQAQPRADVRFSDLGLEDGKEYLVYEFWSKKLVGTFRGSFPAEAQDPKDVHVYAIREKLNRPQVLSTTRHITQGGVDLASVSWSASKTELSGDSDVVAGDPYTVTIHLPKSAGYKAIEAAEGWTVSRDGDLARLSITPSKTGRISWHVRFR